MPDLMSLNILMFFKHKKLHLLTACPEEINKKHNKGLSEKSMFCRFLHKDTFCMDDTGAAQDVLQPGYSLWITSTLQRYHYTV